MAKNSHPLLVKRKKDKSLINQRTHGAVLFVIRHSRSFCFVTSNSRQRAAKSDRIGK